MSKVLVGVPFDESARQLLAQHAEYDVCEFIGHDRLVEVIDRYSAVISGGAQFDTAVFDRATQLKIVSSHGIGFDTIDLEEATQHGVMVTNTPGVMAESVAEHAIALMLAAARNVPLADSDVKHGNASWAKYRGMELCGKTLGQIGLGRIGWLIARKVRDAFNMNVLAYDPYIEPERALTAGATPVLLEELLERSDVVSISTPLNDETCGMLSKERIALMKAGSILVNTARAGILDEVALAESITSGHIASAGLDVYEEPASGKTSLAMMERVVVTPHQGANTTEGFSAIACGTVERVIMALHGKRPLNLLNPAVWADGQSLA